MGRARDGKRVLDKCEKKRHFFRHYVNVIIELCDENAKEDQLRI